MDITLEQINARVQKLDIQTRISRPNTRYRGVRYKKQEGYLQITQKHFDCYVSGSNMDYICFKNAEVNVIFELLLDIFDSYQQWEKEIIAAAKEMDFSTIVSCSWSIFSNPILIMNDNMKILAQFQNVAMDEFSKAYPNLLNSRSVSSELYARSEKAFVRQGIDPTSRRIFLHYTKTDPNSNILCGIIKRGDTIFGRVLLMEYGRTLSMADYQNIYILCSWISEYIPEHGTGSQLSYDNILIRLIEGDPVSETDYEDFYSHTNWRRDDVLQVFIFELRGPNSGKPQRTLLYSFIKECFLELPVFLMGCQILLFGNERIRKSSDILFRVQGSYVDRQDVAIGISLPFKGLRQLREFEKQCQFTLSKMESGKTGYFFECAVDYIISSGDPTEKLCACMPYIKSIYTNHDEDPIQLYSSLRSYLYCGGNLTSAAKELGVHKNTLSYRLGKFFQHLPFDANSPYIREYMLLSIRVIENFKSQVSNTHRYLF